MAYDIFISYRREGGYETAKHLYDLLTKDGYSVSFDIDTLRNGDFDTALFSRIDECKDFLLILDKNAFERTIDPNFPKEKDWLRSELEYALKQNKNIVPIMLNGFVFPDNLPSDIAKVERKNGPKYDRYYFDSFYEKLKNTFLESESKISGDVLSTFEIKVKTDLDSNVYIDDELFMSLKSNTIEKKEIKRGTYLLSIRKNGDENIRIDETIDIYDKDLIIFRELKYAKLATEGYVDLGLSKKWSACNLGSTKPEESGFLFTMNGSSYKNNHNIEINHLVTPTDSVPTGSDLLELCNKCKWEWILYKNVYGYIITGVNGNSIFLPVRPDDGGFSSEKCTGYYLSSNLDILKEDTYVNHRPYVLSFNDVDVSLSYMAGENRLIRTVETKSNGKIELEPEAYNDMIFSPLGNYIDVHEEEIINYYKKNLIYAASKFFREFYQVDHNSAVNKLNVFASAKGLNIEEDRSVVKVESQEDESIELEKLRKQALEDNDPEALVRYAYIIKYDNKPKSIECLQKAANQGNKTAMLELGVFYFEEGQTEDLKRKGIEYIENSIKEGLEGNIPITTLVHYYVSNNEIKKAVRALKYPSLEIIFRDREKIHLSKCILNRIDDREVIVSTLKDIYNINDYCKLLLSLCYYNGYGIGINQQKACDLLKDSDGNELRFLRAFYLLKEKDDENKLKEAFRLLQISNDYPLSQYYMGICYEYGYGVNRDYEMAAQCHFSAIKKNLLISCKKIAEFYDEGKGLELNKDKANYWKYKFLTYGGINYTYYTDEYGDDYGWCSLDELFFKTIFDDNDFANYLIGVEKINNGISQGIDYLEQSAKNGNVFAQRQLAGYYYKGEIVDKDLGKAYKLFSEASQNNDIHSLFSKTILLYNGEGVERDKNKALFLLKECIEKIKNIKVYKNFEEYIKSYFQLRSYRYTIGYHTEIFDYPNLTETPQRPSMQTEITNAEDDFISRYYECRGLIYLLEYEEAKADYFFEMANSHK